LEPDASVGEFLSYAKYVTLVHRASKHPSPIVSMNLYVLHSAVFQASDRMDESKTRKKREADPEVDNEVVRPANFRFIELLEKEAESWGVKDMENLISYMDDTYYKF
jgi:hypothetical protein